MNKPPKKPLFQKILPLLFKILEFISPRFILSGLSDRKENKNAIIRLKRALLRLKDRRLPAMFGAKDPVFGSCMDGRAELLN